MFSFFKPVPAISTQELERLLPSKPIILDVRTPNEFRSGHIKGAKNIPLNRINEYKGTKDKPVYVICQSGMRSSKAAKILIKSGFKVTNVRGGMSHWTSTKVSGGK